MYSNKQKKTFGPNVKTLIIKGISYICNDPYKIGAAIGAIIGATIALAAAAAKVC